MLLNYIDKKLKTAKYKILPDGTFFGEIPSARGVWANNKTLEKCREELREVLEDWLFLRIRSKENIPGFSIKPGKRISLKNYA